jgi:hypothetical protein
MLDAGLWIAFFVALGNQYLTLMTGGAIIFVLMVIERWLRRSVTRKTFAVLAAFVLFLAAFGAWRDEHVKNSGDIIADLTWDNPEDTNAVEVSFNVFVINSRNRGINISAINLVRVSTNFDVARPPSQAISMHPFLDVCKDKIDSPDKLTRSREWKMDDNKSVFVYLMQRELTVDGEPRNSVSVGANQTKYVSGKFFGVKVERDKYNTTTLCIGLKL